MSIYLISNKSDNESRKHILNLNIDNKDLIVLFNHSFPTSFEHIHNHFNKILFLRKFNDSYHGLDQLTQQSRYEKIILINKIKTIHNISNSEIIDELFFNRLMVSLFDQKYPSGKSMTSGFAGFLYCKDKYPYEKLYLVNFTGRRFPKLHYYWDGHDYLFEQEFYKNLNVSMI